MKRLNIKEEGSEEIVDIKRWIRKMEINELYVPIFVAYKGQELSVEWVRFRKVK